MKIKCRSALIGREGKRDEQGRAPFFVELFDVNDPHLKAEVPKKRLDFNKIDNVIIRGLDMEYLVGGSDMLINDLVEIEVGLEKGNKEHLLIKGKQKK
jgi:hypothetical protein